MANTEHNHENDILGFLEESGFSPVADDCFDLENVQVIRHDEGGNAHWWEITEFDEKGHHYTVKFGIDTPGRVIIATLREVLQ